MNHRQGIACLLAPLAGAVVACLGFVATGLAVLDADGSADSWRSVAAHWLGFYLLFGLPVAYSVEGLALWSYRRLNPRGQPGLPIVAATAACIGGALIFAVWGAIGGASFGLLMLPSGFVGGGVGGAVFWAIGLREESHARAV